MGGRASGGGAGGGGGSGMSEKSLDAAINELGNKMAEYAQYALPGPNYDAKKASKYYEYKNKYNEAKMQKNAMLDKKAAARPKTQTPAKTYVNGYGEATRRNITSLTYERAQKRLKKQIDDLFKGR